MTKIAVIGSMSMDFVVQTEIVPEQGETVLGQSFKTFCGGKGANQGIAAARSGLDVIMIGAVGSDGFGDEIIANLTKNNINTDFIKKVDGQASGSAHITINEGDNRIVVVPGANYAITEELVDEALNQHSDIELMILQNEIPMAINAYAVKRANELGIKTLYNPAPAITVDQAILSDVSYLTPNEHEFKLLFDTSDLLAVLKEYEEKLLITQGANGVTFAKEQQLVTIPANKVANIVDTTGAGDTFNGYFAKGLVSDLTIEDSIKLGNLASSIAIQSEGAQDGIPTLAELKECEQYEKKWNLK